MHFLFLCDQIYIKFTSYTYFLVFKTKLFHKIVLTLDNFKCFKFINMEYE